MYTPNGFFERQIKSILEILVNTRIYQYKQELYIVKCCFLHNTKALVLQNCFYKSTSGYSRICKHFIASRRLVTDSRNLISKSRRFLV